MTWLRIFIVEDEPIIVATIESMLQKFGYKVLGDADNFDDAIQKIKQTKPDLVLLDVQLDGEKDGVDLAMVLDEIGIQYMYLTSQTDQYTTAKITQTHPIGYAAKPFTENSLRSNIEIAWNSKKTEPTEFLTITVNQDIYKIKQQNILFLQALDNYCYVYYKDEKLLIPKTLKFVSEQLNPQNFRKCHRTYVVNLKKINSISKNSIKILEHEIPLSKAHKNEFLALLKK